jgi:outer membrane lipopolysaccharide assembly protein LptE/RlpB
LCLDRSLRKTSRFRAATAPAALLALAALAAAIFSIAGCGYHVAGRANLLPATIKTIAVPAFTNRTANYRIEERLTNAVVHEFLARTTYHIVPKPDDADAVLRGEVDTIGNSAEIFDPVTGRATTVLVTVTMKVRLEDRATGNVLYHNDNFVFREPYEISTDIPSFFEEESPALDRLSRDFAQRLVSDVLEQF